MFKKNYFDFATLFIMVLTLLLFILAIFLKGITHDLLLEAGVLLVSIKLIIMSYKNGKAEENMAKELKEIKELLSAKTRKSKR